MRSSSASLVRLSIKTKKSVVVVISSSQRFTPGEIEISALIVKESPDLGL